LKNAAKERAPEQSGAGTHRTSERWRATILRRNRFRSAARPRAIFFQLRLSNPHQESRLRVLSFQMTPRCEIRRNPLDL